MSEIEGLQKAIETGRANLNSDFEKYWHHLTSTENMDAQIHT